MNPVVHFELPADDQKGLADFYASVFGWEFNQLGPEMGNYTVVMTAESDENGPKKLGIINGGIYKKTPEMGSMHPSVVIAVEDVDEHLKKIEAAGGTTHGKPMEIPGVGTYAMFTDPQGNMLSVLKPIRYMPGSEA
jgi:uncharacterized protein